MAAHRHGTQLPPKRFGDVLAWTLFSPLPAELKKSSKPTAVDPIPQKLWLRGLQWDEGPAMGPAWSSWAPSSPHSSHLLYSSCPWFPIQATPHESPLSHSAKPVVEVLENQTVKISEANCNTKNAFSKVEESFCDSI